MPDPVNYLFFTCFFFCYYNWLGRYYLVKAYKDSGLQAYRIIKTK